MPDATTSDRARLDRSRSRAGAARAGLFLAIIAGLSPRTASATPPAASTTPPAAIASTIATGTTASALGPPATSGQPSAPAPTPPAAIDELADAQSGTHAVLPPKVPPAIPQQHREGWYGQLPLAVDLLSIGALTLLERTSPGARDTTLRQAAWGASAGAYIFFAPYHHNTHLGPPPGLTLSSIFLRLGAPAIGGLTGLLIGPRRHPAPGARTASELPRTWIDAGALVGMVSAALFDDLLLARRMATKRTSQAPRVVPTVGAASQGATLGVSGLW